MLQKQIRIPRRMFVLGLFVLIVGVWFGGGDRGLVRDALNSGQNEAAAPVDDGGLQGRFGRGDDEPLIDKPIGERIAFSGRRVVRLYSAEGLPLPNLEELGIDGEWSPLMDTQALENLGVDVFLPTGVTLSVRAGGHGPIEIGPDMDEATLIADALLQIDCPGIEAFLSEVEVFSAFESDWGDYFRGISSFGCVGPDRFLLAVRVDSYRTVFHNVDASMLLRLDGLGRINVEFNPVSGCRNRAILPGIQREQAVSALAIDLLQNGHPWRGGEVVAQCWSNRGGGAPRDTLRSVQVGEWGSVALRSDGMVSRGESGSDRIDLGKLVIGNPYRVCVLGMNGSGGVFEFVHDGSPVEVTMLPGVTIRGRFVWDRGSLPPNGRVHWNVSNLDLEAEEPADGSGERQQWSDGPGDEGRFAISADGSFELVVPRLGAGGSIPTRKTAPKEIMLEFDIPGFLKRSFEVHTFGRFVVETVVVDLESKPVDLSLRGSPLISADSYLWQPVFVKGLALENEFRIDSVKAERGGLIGLVLERSEELGFPIFRTRNPNQKVGLDFRDPIPACILLEGLDPVGHTRPVAFELVEVGEVPVYRGVPMGEISVIVTQLSPLPEGDEIVVGWTWAGIQYQAWHSASAEEAQVEEFELVLPVEVEALWWSHIENQKLVWPPVSYGISRSGATSIAIR